MYPPLWTSDYVTNWNQEAVKKYFRQNSTPEAGKELSAFNTIIRVQWLWYAYFQSLMKAKNRGQTYSKKFIAPTCFINLFQDYCICEPSHALEPENTCINTNACINIHELLVGTMQSRHLMYSYELACNQVGPSHFPSICKMSILQLTKPMIRTVLLSAIYSPI